MAMLLVWSLLACQEPFGADRHDLRGFRIAALTASVEGEQVRPRVAMIVDGRPWSSTRVNLDWAFVDAPGEAVDEPAPVASGPDALLERTSQRLALHASLDEHSVWAELDLTDRTELTPTITVADPGESVAGHTIEDLTREARASWTTEPTRSVEPGSFARLTLDGAPDTALGRFMATGDGTWFELEGDVADWAAAEVTIDDDEIFTEPIETGVYTVLVNAVDTTASGFVATEVHVGTEQDGVYVHDRFLPGPRIGTGRYWVSLSADDDAPSGLAFADPQPAEPDAAWDPARAGCLGVSGPFDPSWLLQMRCGRDGLAGARVLIEVDP